MLIYAIPLLLSVCPEIEINVTKIVGRNFRFSITEFFEQIAEVLPQIEHTVICLNENENELARGKIEKIDLKNRRIVLTFSANCRKLKIVIHRLHEQ